MSQSSSPRAGHRAPASSWNIGEVRLFGLSRGAATAVGAVVMIALGAIGWLVWVTLDSLVATLLTIMTVLAMYGGFMTTTVGHTLFSRILRRQ